MSGAGAKNPAGYRDLPFALPQVEAGEKRRAKRLLKALQERYPDAKCALNYSTPHELLVATILSAQTTDAAVNKATPALFEKFPTPKAFAEAAPEEIQPYIQSLGFFRNKAKAIHLAMKDVVERFGGDVPRTMDELLSLHGVARKTANVVLGNAFGINDGFVVDTHIERLSKRFGLAPKDATVAMVERHLAARFPRDEWMHLSHMLISHGRGPCKARGAACGTDEICRKFCPDPESLCSNAVVKEKKTGAKKKTKKKAVKKTAKKKARTAKK
ncbi:MAG: endonuclease III [Planctomycetota bacterium]|nr:endonuclease III [Planctomycetota bacterium]